MTGDPGVQERIERSHAGRVVISVLLVVFLVVLVIMNAQQSAVRKEVLGVATPALNATGLDQGWGVFAPDPRNMSIEFVARVHYVDGTTETWTLPEGGPLLGDYWDYRWRKYLEYLVQDNWAHQTRRQFSAYIARQVHGDGRLPKRIVLVRRLRSIRPGESPPMSAPREQAYYVHRVDPRDLAR